MPCTRAQTERSECACIAFVTDVHPPAPVRWAVPGIIPGLRSRGCQGVPPPCLQTPSAGARRSCHPAREAACVRLSVWPVLDLMTRLMGRTEPLARGAASARRRQADPLTCIRVRGCADHLQVSGAELLGQDR
jgi:hypothetical protein